MSQGRQETNKVALKSPNFRDFPGGQWLGLPSSSAGGTGSIPGWGNKILCTTRCGQKNIVFNFLSPKYFSLSSSLYLLTCLYCLPMAMMVKNLSL